MTRHDASDRTVTNGKLPVLSLNETAVSSEEEDTASANFSPHFPQQLLSENISACGLAVINSRSRLLTFSHSMPCSMGLIEKS
jgi:hypothetical protein